MHHSISCMNAKLGGSYEICTNENYPQSDIIILVCILLVNHFATNCVHFSPAALGPTIQANLAVTGTDATLTCTASSTTATNFSSDLQWIGPDGSVLSQMSSTNSLVLELTPIAEFGDYVCVATLTSPDRPGFTSTVSATLPIDRK